MINIKKVDIFYIICFNNIQLGYKNVIELIKYLEE